MVLFKRIAFSGEYLERNERYPRLIFTCFRIPDFTSIDKEYWFWFLPKSGDAPEDLQIVFITIVNAEDPDRFEVVWPKELKNKDKQAVFDLFYKKQK